MKKLLAISTPMFTVSVFGSIYIGSFNGSGTGLTGITNFTSPFVVKGASTGNNEAAFDWFETSVPDAWDSNGVAHVSTPVIDIGYNRKQNTYDRQNAVGHFEMNMEAPAGNGPWYFATNRFALSAVGRWPNQASNILNTANNGFIPQNVGIVQGFGHHDTTLEIDSSGSASAGFSVLSLGMEGLFPGDTAFFYAVGVSNTSRGVTVVHEGIPLSGDLFGVQTTYNASAPYLFKIDGPKSSPGGSYSAGGAFADLKITGNAIVNSSIGIGTATPTAKLNVNYSGLYSSNTTRYIDVTGDFLGTNSATVSNAGAFTGFRMGHTNIGKYAMFGAVSEDTLGYSRMTGLSFWTSPQDAVPQERVRISNSGFFGIGTNTPDSMLHVNGNAHFNGTATANSFAGNGGGLIFTNALGNKFTLIINSSTNGFNFVPH